MREEDLELKLMDIATRISRLYSELELLREEVFQLIRSLREGVV